MSEPSRQNGAPPKVDRIGRYTIERFLARGGMAEVFLGKAEGPGGFAKQVVVKRIHPDLCEEDRFVTMFLDEAKLAALLSHPNIVQVFDFGQQDGLYYIAMEYVPGESLRAMVRALGNMGRKLSPRVAAAIVAGICEGLQYAHTLTDESGQPANIIHRDVTPDNILVSASGVPKLVDFGIAKASSQTNRTEGGMLKGKYGYMSPEQIKGEGIDHRLDVYALGITLYEILAGHRPYRAENELQLMREIIAAQAAPLNTVNSEVPEFLAEVVANAMHPDPDLRYHDARAFQTGLEDYLHSTGPRVQAAEIAEVVKEVSLHRRARADVVQPTPSPSGGTPGTGPKAKPTSAPKPSASLIASLPDLSDEVEEADATRRMELSDLLDDGAPSEADATRKVNLADLQALSALAEPPTASAKSPLAPAPKAADPDPQPSLEDLIMEPVEVTGSKPLVALDDGTRKLRYPEPPAAPEVTAATDPHNALVRGPGRPGWLIPALGAGGVILLAGLGFALFHGGGAPEKPKQQEPLLLTSPKPAPEAKPEAQAKPSAPAPQPKPESKPQVAETKPAPKPDASPAATADAKPGYLTVKSERTFEIYIDGQKLGATPLPRVELTAGKHDLVAKSASLGLEKRYAITIASGAEQTREIAIGKGKLEVKVQPWAKVTVDGKDVGTTPFPPIELTEGSHKVVLSNPELSKTDSRTVHIKAGGKETVKVLW